MNFSSTDLRTIKGFTFIGNEFGTWTTFGTTRTATFLCGKELRVIKFNLTFEEESDWEELTSMVVRQWSHLLEENDDQPVFWVGFYINGQEDPALVFRCTRDFTVSCVQWYNMTLPLPVTCYTVGIHSRCLREWEKPLDEIDGFFHEVKVISTTRGQKKKRRGKIRNHFFLW